MNLGHPIVFIYKVIIIHQPWTSHCVHIYYKEIIIHEQYGER